MLAAIEQCHIPWYSNMMNNLLTYTYIVLYACIARLSNWFCPSACLLSARKSPDLKILACERLINATNLSKLQKKLASLCFKLSTRVAKTIFYWSCAYQSYPHVYVKVVNRHTHAAAHRRIRVSALRSSSPCLCNGSISFVHATIIH